MLTLTSEHVQAMQAHAENTYPEECCGLLLGSIDRHPGNESRRCIQAVVAVANTWGANSQTQLPDHLSLSDTSKSDGDKSQPSEANNRRRRYWIDPKDMLAVQRMARDRNLNILGVYHSHPDYPAVPSECDRQLAWLDYSYIIISVIEGQSEAIKSWVLDDNHQFQSEPMTVSAPIPMPSMPRWGH